MTFVFETFKVNKNLEDNPDEISERLVNVKDLVSARLTKKTKRIDDLIAIEQEKQQIQEDSKLKGLHQVDEQYLAPIMAQQSNKTAKVWRAIKDLDDDKNGFLSVEELELCFREQFPVALDGKSLVYYFRRWSTDHDKDLVNYRTIKESLIEAMEGYRTKTPTKAFESEQ